LASANADDRFDCCLGDSVASKDGTDAGFNRFRGGGTLAATDTAVCMTIDSLTVGGVLFPVAVDRFNAYSVFAALAVAGNGDCFKSL
jgi:hypothetical protein